MYSKRYKFFLTHQIGVATTNKGRETVFFSLLNGERFKKMVSAIPLTDQQIQDECRSIHQGVKILLSNSKSGN